MSASSYERWRSPVGELLLVASDEALLEIRFPKEVREHSVDPDWTRGGRLLERTIVQLEEYFGGERRTFDLPLEPHGTDFQREVWGALVEIPYGETTSYGALAGRIGRPGSSRAVGAANGRNPIPIVIPCHRVIGKDGSLTGFGGGLPIKRRLLELEGGLLPFGG